MKQASVYNLYQGWWLLRDSNGVRSVYQPEGASRMVVPFQSVSRKASVQWH